MDMGFNLALFIIHPQLLLNYQIYIYIKKLPLTIKYNLWSGTCAANFKKAKQAKSKAQGSIIQQTSKFL